MSKGGKGSNCPGPRCKGAPVMKFIVSNKILVWNIFAIQKRYKLTTLLYIIFLCFVKYQGHRQQPISLHVWRSASFSNRYWIAYKYFRFCSMQIYLISLVTFPIIVLLAWVWLSTHVPRLLHKCHENDTMCVLKIVVADCCLVWNSLATGVSLVNIRLQPFSTSDNIKFYVTVPYKLIASINKSNKAGWTSFNPKQSETSPLNGEVVYNLRKMLVSAQRRELLWFETITKHTLGWVIDKRKFNIMNLTYFRPKMRGNVEHKNNNPVNIRFVDKISDIRNLSEHITSDVMLIYQKWQHWYQWSRTSGTVSR